MNTKVSDAQSAMQKTEDAMNTAVEQMNKRLDANVTASTDAKADYAAELVDVRVGQDGTVYPSAGEAIRGQYSQAVENGITGAKLALAGSNGNLGEVFPKAAMPALLGAKCEAGEFLDYRITGTTDYGQFYHRFTNMLMGKFRKYLFISKIREISGSCAGVSCYQYDSKGANLNTHVTKAIRVAHGSESYVVFFGEILENAYRLDISPCVARKEAVVECDSRCVLLDVTGQSDEELQKVLSLISSSPVEDSILQYYDTWGIAGKVMSVPYADRTGISDQAREMLGNVAYGCPVFSEMIPFSSKFQEKDTTYAWAKAAVTRSEDWGVFGGVRLSGLAAGKYLVFGRVEYQVVRKELFAHLRDPAIVIRKDSITFNTACITGLEDVVYVHVMFNNDLKRIVVRGCDENDKDALRWCIAKPDKRKSRKMSCKPFAELVYKEMDWDSECRYKVLGYRITFEGETLYVFDLLVPEIFHERQSRKKETVAEQPTDQETKPVDTRKGFYPDDIAGTFGVPVEEHLRESEVRQMDGYVSMGVLTGRTVPDTGLD